MLRPCRSDSFHIHVCCVLHAVSLCNDLLTDRILAHYVTAQTKQVKCQKMQNQCNSAIKIGNKGLNKVYIVMHIYSSERYVQPVVFLLCSWSPIHYFLMLYAIRHTEHR